LGMLAGEDGVSPKPGGVICSASQHPAWEIGLRCRLRHRFHALRWESRLCRRIPALVLVRDDVFR